MRQGISITVDAAARARLAAIVADRNRPQKHVWRARIILLTADGVGRSGIERQTGKDKTCVWRWQERFMREGVDEFLRDKTRRPGKPPLAKRAAGEATEFSRSRVELLSVIGAARLECGKPAAEAVELIRRQLGNSFGHFSTFMWRYSYDEVKDPCRSVCVPPA